MEHAAPNSNQVISQRHLIKQSIKIPKLKPNDEIKNNLSTKINSLQCNQQQDSRAQPALMEVTYPEKPAALAEPAEPQPASIPYRRFSFGRTASNELSLSDLQPHNPVVTGARLEVLEVAVPNLSKVRIF